MSQDARAKIRLKDGREVWRMVAVTYREIGSGRWVSAHEVDRLLPDGMDAGPPHPASPRPDMDQIRQQIVEVQAQIAMDKEAGARSTSAARLVLKTFAEMEEKEGGLEPDLPWFVLGRQLAEQVLRLLEAESGERTEPSSQI